MDNENSNLAAMRIPAPPRRPKTPPRSQKAISNPAGELELEEFVRNATNASNYHSYFTLSRLVDSFSQ